jgi:predicted transcriptional regulator
MFSVINRTVHYYLCLNKERNDKLKCKKKQNDNKKTDINEMLLQGFLHINNRMRALHEGKASRKRILIVLCEQDNMTMNQKELTKYLGIQPGSASEILSNLEKTGMITRR